MIGAANAKPIPDEVKELFDYLMRYAETGRLGLLSTIDKKTGETRFTLFGQHPVGDGFTLVPLGFLSTTAGEEVDPPGLPPIVDLVPNYDGYLQVFNCELDRWADDGGPAYG